jgi:hypothetical protein
MDALLAVLQFLSEMALPEGEAIDHALSAALQGLVFFVPVVDLLLQLVLLALELPVGVLDGVILLGVPGLRKKSGLLSLTVSSLKK